METIAGSMPPNTRRVRNMMTSAVTMPGSWLVDVNVTIPTCQGVSTTVSWLGGAVAVRYPGNLTRCFSRANCAKNCQDGLQLLFPLALSVFSIPTVLAQESASSHDPVGQAHRRLAAVIEIPAGTTTKIEFQGKVEGFTARNGPEGAIRRVRFLPYPGNYGFIPETCQSVELGGDGDPLDVLVISDSVPTGTEL